MLDFTIRRLNITLVIFVHENVATEDRSSIFSNPQSFSKQALYDRSIQYQFLHSSHKPSRQTTHQIVAKIRNGTSEKLSCKTFKSDGKATIAEPWTQIGRQLSA